RKSSADGPSSLTKAVTSHDDIRMRAPPIFTVVIDLPREGGVAINCSQTCSMQVSKSCAPEGSGFAARASGTSFGFTLDGEAFGSGTPFFAVRLCLEVSPSTF